MAGRRQFILFGALALTAGLSAWLAVADDGGQVALPAERSTTPRVAAAPASAPPALPLDQLQRALAPVEDSNPFAATSWTPPSPVVAAPPPEAQAAPAAPILPFVYQGKLEDDGMWVVYLSKGAQTFAVSKGDTFDTNYRLDDIDNGNLVIIYLPLSIRQLLPTGAPSL
jgi:hypothetical protein